MSDTAVMDAVLKEAQETAFPGLGELVTGTIVDLTKNRALVDLCEGLAVGLIAGRETYDSIGTFKDLEVGSEVQAVVVEDENDEGFYVLSLRRAAQNTAWDRFEVMNTKGTVFSAKPVEANKGGLLLDIDGIKAFIPVSQLAPMHYPRVNDANSAEILRRLQALIGEKFNVRIISIDRENGKLILSERAAEQEGRDDALAALKVGDVKKGHISGIVKFGIFVAFDGLEGLVHISEIAWGHVRNPADYGKMGDDVEVMIIGVEGDKISLSVKRLQKDPWVEAAKKYTVGSSITGKINRITTFGAFVTLEADINGLIHLSEISHEKVEDIEKFIKVGQEIEAKVINMDLDEHRIGLSIKAMTEAPGLHSDSSDLAEVSDEKKGSAPSDVEEKTEEAIPDTDSDGKSSSLSLDDLDGISAKNAVTLKAAGFDLEKLKGTTKEALVELDGIGDKTAEKILEAAKAA
jgi:small subunit ribosomal protein S1